MTSVVVPTLIVEVPMGSVVAPTGKGGRSGCGVTGKACGFVRTIVEVEIRGARGEGGAAITLGGEFGAAAGTAGVDDATDTIVITFCGVVVATGTRGSECLKCEYVDVTVT
jgi:hypothetical protein